MCTKNFKALAKVAIVSAAGFLCPAVLLAQDGLSVLSPAAAKQLLEQYSTGTVDTSQALIAPSADIPDSPFTEEIDGSKIHMLPTTDYAKTVEASSATPSGPLLYHSGGSVMNPTVTIYPIFWVPARLQNGGATGMTSHYQAVQITMLSDYFGHGIANISTQYYQTIGGKTTFIQNKGALGTAYLDTIAYPASGCHDPATPGNCLTDAQIRAEVQRVLNFAHLTGGLNKIFMLFTSSGEGSCFDATNRSCAYTQYCAYHSHYSNGTTPVLYSNQPFGTTHGCQVPGVPSPNNDPVADAASTAASHELTETVTDPLLNAWFTSSGQEIGDLCNLLYGSRTWFGIANQMWNGHLYLLQTQYDNHDQGCFQVGPA